VVTAGARVVNTASDAVLKLFAGFDRKHEKHDAPDIYTLLRQYGHAGNEDRLFGEQWVFSKRKATISSSRERVLSQKDARRAISGRHANALNGNPKIGSAHGGTRKPDDRLFRAK
jgi:predicted nucleotidyltransferase